jgi:hypothetical protein
LLPKHLENSEIKLPLRLALVCDWALIVDLNGDCNTANQYIISSVGSKRKYKPFLLGLKIQPSFEGNPHLSQNAWSLHHKDGQQVDSSVDDELK